MAIQGEKVAGPLEVSIVLGQTARDHRVTVAGVDVTRGLRGLSLDVGVDRLPVVSLDIVAPRPVEIAGAAFVRGRCRCGCGEWVVLSVGAPELPEAAGVDQAVSNAER